MVRSQPRDPERPNARPRLGTHLDAPSIEHKLGRDMIEKIQSPRRRINSTIPYQLLAEAFDLQRVRPQLLQRHRERPLANVDLYPSLAQPMVCAGRGRLPRR